MKIITTHLSADFDGFASAVCARRLFPGHELVFPGSLEPSVRRFRDAVMPEIETVGIRELRKHRLEHAVVLDTPDSARLGEVWDIIRRDDCPITRIDHHTEGDLPERDGDLIRPGGSTATLICEIFSKKGIHPTPEESSLLLLGIYEDTGNLCFRETGPPDFRAVAWLLDEGADLGWVRRWLSRTLNTEQLLLLRRLVEGAEERRFGSIPCVISSVEIEDYPEEAAAAVHQWVDAFRLPVVAVLLIRPSSIRIIFRSRLEEMDVGEIARTLGGGGHTTAASARVRGMMPVELRKRIWEMFRSRVPGRPTAGDVALQQIFSIERNSTVVRAAEQLTMWRINAAPVIDHNEGDFCGAVTRQILDRALSLGLGDNPIDTVMHPGVLTVEAETPLDDLRELFLQNPDRFAIVRRTDQVIGILTRTELLRKLFSIDSPRAHSLDNRMAAFRPKHQNVAGILKAGLPEWAVPLVEQVRNLCREGSPRVYLVGGAVRDLLLGRPFEDLDFVVEGNGIAFARELAGKLHARCHSHETFMTAVISLPDGHNVDVVSARTESYSAPAVLPDVSASLIRQDLYRRDFTINTLAISLSGEEYGRLNDFFGGRRDLENRRIRALHSLSFIDDPTRAFRAVRYARRLDFEISPDTRELILTAVREKIFDRLSAHRLGTELRLLFAEEHPASSIRLLADFSLLGAISPILRWSHAIHSHLLDLQAQAAWYEVEILQPPPSTLLMYLGALLIFSAVENGVPIEEAEGFDSIRQRLQLSGIHEKIFLSLPGYTGKLVEIADRDVPISTVFRTITKSGPESLLIAMALCPLQQRRVLAEACEKGHHTVTPIKGKDLIEVGIPESPLIGKLLDMVRSALLDGVIEPDQALKYALDAAEDAKEAG